MFGIDDAILGAALSFGGKLLSGIGAGQSASKANKRAVNLQAFADAQNQRLQADKNAADRDLGLSLISRADTMPDVDLSGWWAAGNAAGFNPVTWLNAGTLSLWDHRAEKAAFIQQGTSLQSPGVTQYGVAQQQAVPSTMSAIGGAISAGADSWSSSVQAQAKIDAQQAGMAALLGAVQTARAKGNPLAGLGTPAFSMAGQLISGGGAAAALSLGGVPRPKEFGGTGSSSDSDTNKYGLEEKDAERIKGFGSLNWQTDPALSNAEAFEDRYGDVLSEFAGLGVFLGDTYRNVTGRSFMDDWNASDAARKAASQPKAGAWTWSDLMRGAAGYFSPRSGGMPNLGYPSP